MSRGEDHNSLAAELGRKHDDRVRLERRIELEAVDLIRELNERYLTLLDWDFNYEAAEDFHNRVQQVLRTGTQSASEGKLEELKK